VIGGKSRLYGCSYAQKRGESVCRNDFVQTVHLADAAFLAALEREILTPDRFRYAVQCAVDHVRQRLAENPDLRPALLREKVALERKIGNGSSAQFVGDFCE
jgi:hypothetical protein